MKYMKTFNTEAEYIEYEKTTICIPSVYYIKDIDKVVYTGVTEGTLESNLYWGNVPITESSNFIKKEPLCLNDGQPIIIEP